MSKEFDDCQSPREERLPEREADHARNKRFVGALEALHSGRLDGLPTSPAAIRDAWDYVEGRRTLDEIIEDVVIRHTRIPDGPEERPR